MSPQALLVEGVRIVGVNSLKELYLHLKQEALISPTTPTPYTLIEPLPTPSPVLDDIVGQEQAKRALVIAAAGRHNILFSGSPGAGKTMLAKTLRNLMPPMSSAEKIAVTKLHSLAGDSIDAVVQTRPFRTPHHTASRTALIGGGTKPLPGEISLAHHGILFLDEVPEYPRSTLESLRQPLEDRTITVNRASGRATYPADFVLVATMNPCPCGYYGDSSKECGCSSQQIMSYQKRLSGPFLDRIDMTITMSRIPTATLFDINSSSLEQHDTARRSIITAYDLQHDRYKSSHKNNANATSEDIKQVFYLSDSAQQILETASEKLHLSVRSYFKIVRVARTIADLDANYSIESNHIAEALQYRQVSP